MAVASSCKFIHVMRVTSEFIESQQSLYVTVHQAINLQNEPIFCKIHSSLTTTAIYLKF